MTNERTDRTEGTESPRPEGPPDPFDAIVLAGGEGVRLGGVDKASVVVGGRPMLEHVLAAVAGARRLVVVGPAGLDAFGTARVQEDPPLGGPVAGIDAGLTHLGAAGDVPVLVLACDLPLAAPAVADLLAARAQAPAADGAALVDAEGRRQSLLAVYRREALVTALDRLRAGGGVHGASMRRLLDGLDVVEVPDRTGAGQDADTWEAVAWLEAVISERTP
ncbi:molybdenum cofactor guanylyltransferase [Actinotalea sp.]|uniref:molybdenum cofactor guanylyltransferase n=1 Tax=Actinotalea sp. TaxID=1872145 RepID=UPI002BCE06DE|nr:molybdenum cofactor guanylyltransferase [Actinotalea sp.]HQY34467.1 molybdenum cofactor guanylyltransferase [Actinotalea sp.]HRA51068.1 molybdenum cofactor guanylyltransferase [Actinotalea sp.]